MLPATRGRATAPSLLQQRRDHRPQRLSVRHPAAARPPDRQVLSPGGPPRPRRGAAREAPEAASWLIFSSSARSRSIRWPLPSARSTRPWAGRPPTSPMRPASSRRVRLVATVGADFPEEHVSCSSGARRRRGRAPAQRRGPHLPLGGRVRLRPQRGPDPGHPAQRARHLPARSCRTPCAGCPTSSWPTSIPELQLDVLRQMAERPRLVALDTMNFWIQGKREALAASPPRGRRHHHQRRRGPPAGRRAQPHPRRPRHRRAWGPAWWS